MSLKSWYSRRAAHDSGAEDLVPTPQKEAVCYTAAAPAYPVPLTVCRPPPKKLVAPD